MFLPRLNVSDGAFQLRGVDLPPPHLLAPDLPPDWLLDNGVDPGAICWVRPRDPWMFNRAVIQPNPAVFIGMAADTVEAAAQAAVLSRPVILCSAQLRPHLRRLTERFLPDLAVIAHGEVAPGIRLLSMGTVS